MGESYRQYLAVVLKGFLMLILLILSVCVLTIGCLGGLSSESAAAYPTLFSSLLPPLPARVALLFILQTARKEGLCDWEYR